jgi:predicted ATP-grasp superfamily ATP-dependent carboligase
MISGGTVLVLDGDTRAALAVVRSLGRKGLRVIVGAESRSPLVGASRYCDHTVTYMSPNSPESFCESLCAILQKEKPDILFPITDLSVYAVLINSSRLRSLVKIPLVDIDKYWAASDKCELVRMGQRIGIACPKTWFAEKPFDGDRLPSDLEYPLVLKPRASLRVSGDSVQKTSVQFAKDKAAMLAILQADPGFQNGFMIQEKINGEGLGIFALCENGDSVAIFSHKRIREKPPWGGVSVVCESTIPDPIAKENACRLLKELRWTGVAMVEFKRDNRTGIPMLMEINARFWGSLQLAVDAGVDFPYLLYLQGCKKETPVTSTYHLARSRWLLGDLDSLLICLKMPGKNLSMPITFWGKVLAIFRFVVEFFRGSKIEEVRYFDLGIFFRSFSQWIHNIFAR